MSRAKMAAWVVFVAFATGLASLVLANGGPFVIKYPEGDPAAKGVLARLDPDLKPGRETRLRVVKEDLKVVFSTDRYVPKDAVVPPLVEVTAGYTIENPTGEEIEVDFGFPILRGVYINPLSMMPRPEVRVVLDKNDLPVTIISNSAIYGIIRARAREVIEKAVESDASLKKLVAAVRTPNQAQTDAPRRALAAHLTNKMKWNEKDAALMVEYASLDFGKTKTRAPDAYPFWGFGAERDAALPDLVRSNLGPLGAIGEQKATQFFAQLASRFDPKAAAAYEAIFTAWGGEVQERSVDLETGKVRPREITVDPSALGKDSFPHIPDPTIYVRVDYLDEKAPINDAEKASCKGILKNLPVVFTFAPMNLLHYEAKFAAKSTQTLTVSYRQYAYADTRKPSSYQLAYVVHPASMWDSFGPINIEVAAPKAVGFRASVPCESADGGQREVSGPKGTVKLAYTSYKATLKDKTGELFLALDKEQWEKVLSRTAETAQR